MYILYIYDEQLNYWDWFISNQSRPWTISWTKQPTPNVAVWMVPGTVDITK